MGEVERKLGGGRRLARPHEAASAIPTPRAVPRFTLEEGALRWHLQ